MSNDLSSELQQLAENVRRLNDADASAETLLKGLHDQLETVAANMQAAGVDAAELQQLHDLNAQIAARTSELAQAVTANTPASTDASTQAGGTGATGPADAASAVPPEQSQA